MLTQEKKEILWMGYRSMVRLELHGCTMVNRPVLKEDGSLWTESAEGLRLQLLYGDGEPMDLRMPGQLLLAAEALGQFHDSARGVRLTSEWGRLGAKWRTLVADVRRFYELEPEDGFSAAAAGLKDRLIAAADRLEQMLVSDEYVDCLERSMLDLEVGIGTDLAGRFQLVDGRVMLAPVYDVANRMVLEDVAGLLRACDGNARQVLEAYCTGRGRMLQATDWRIVEAFRQYPSATAKTIRRYLKGGDDSKGNLTERLLRCAREELEVGKGGDGHGDQA